MAYLTRREQGTGWFSQADQKFNGSNPVWGGSVGITTTPSTYNYLSNAGNDPVSNGINQTWAKFIGNDTFAPYKTNLGLQSTLRSKEEIASSYQALAPDLYNQYVNGSISGTQLWNGAMKVASLNDSDILNNGYMNTYNLQAPPKVKFSFNRSGGGSITSSGFGANRW